MPGEKSFGRKFHQPHKIFVTLPLVLQFSPFFTLRWEEVKSSNECRSWKIVSPAADFDRRLSNMMRLPVGAFCRNVVQLSLQEIHHTVE